MSTLSKPQTAEKIREKFTRFRILVIGRANAGKTTILRRLCNAIGEPVIFSPNGKKIESSTLDPSEKRGEHDIENEMMFESNPGFIFHDSPGFEAGSARELKRVQEFIAQYSKATNVDEQLHAIWYCIPTSDDRPITAAEKKFFNECGTGLVPVIVVWTKTESLDLAKIKQLMKEGNSKSEAMQQAPQKSWADFEKNIHHHFDQFKYPPKAYVVFRNMHQPGADCNDLIEKTTAALSTEELQQLFLSTQTNSVELCIVYGIKRVVNLTESALLKYFKDNNGNWACFMGIVLGYFPQIHFWDWDDFPWELRAAEEENTWRREHHNKDSISRIMLFVLSGLSTKCNLEEATYCAIVAAIVGHLSFCLCQQSSNKMDSLERGAQIYQQSTCDTSVKQAVENLFKNSHVDHAFSNILKQSHVDHAMLVEGAIQTALNNLLSPNLHAT